MQTLYHDVYSIYGEEIVFALITVFCVGFNEVAIYCSFSVDEAIYCWYVDIGFDIKSQIHHLLLKLVLMKYITADIGTDEVAISIANISIDEVAIYRWFWYWWSTYLLILVLMKYLSTADISIDKVAT